MKVRGGLVFVNLRVERSLTDHCFWVPEQGNHCVVLSSDNGRFGGFDRPNDAFAYETWEHQPSLCLPGRVALVLESHGAANPSAVVNFK